MLRIAQDKATLAINTSKALNVMVWVNLCDLKANKDATLFITDGPVNLGQNQLPPDLKNLFFVTYNDLSGFGQVPVKVSQVILPGLDEVKLGRHSAYIEVPKGVSDTIKSLMLKNPDLKFGLGARYVED